MFETDELNFCKRKLNFCILSTIETVAAPSKPRIRVLDLSLFINEKTKTMVKGQETINNDLTNLRLEMTPQPLFLVVTFHL